MKKIIIPAILYSLILAFFACSTIYNYDLSIGGLDDLPATKACLTKYLPKSVDAQKGQQGREIAPITLIFDEHEAEIKDSLLADSVVFEDNSYLLKFKIVALDPFDEVTETTYVIITHLGCIRYMISFLLGMPDEYSWRFRVDNGSLVRICINQDRYAYLKM